MTEFQALLLEEQAGAVQAAVKTLDTSALPPGDVLVQVHYSSLNYKDGLAVLNRAKVIRSYPMVPGIDFAGTVVESQSPTYKPGDAVILTGWGVGERHWGGFAGMARVKADWLVPLPEGMTLQRSMVIGTAGFTAMLAVMALEEQGVAPGGREVLVTGAAGGVGSVAVALLAKRGYTVAASTGRAETHEYLMQLGASTIIERGALAAPSNRPLESERWAGAVDTVGGDTLAGVLRQAAYHAVVAACGNAGGVALNTTVLPFILRGVQLVGIDSVLCPFERRTRAWNLLAQELTSDVLDSMTQLIALDQVPAFSETILAGQVRGRVVVDLTR
jgi:acrylyl-CoA reductase (NADPH)